MISNCCKAFKKPLLYQYHGVNNNTKRIHWIVISCWTKVIVFESCSQALNCAHVFKSISTNARPILLLPSWALLSSFSASVSHHRHYLKIQVLRGFKIKVQYNNEQSEDRDIGTWDNNPKQKKGSRKYSLGWIQNNEQKPLKMINTVSVMWVSLQDLGKTIKEGWRKLWTQMRTCKINGRKIDWPHQPSGIIPLSVQAQLSTQNALLI